MNSAIHVGNKVDKETTSNLKELIETILKVGYENHMEQDTIQTALSMVGQVVEVKDINITNSNFTGDKIVNMDED